MDRNNVHPIQVSNNTKFLNCLQPEWSKYVTMVRHNQTGDTVSYDVLYDSSVKFEPHFLASKARKATKNHDPLAVIAHSNASLSQSHANFSYSPQSYYVTHPSSVVDYEDEYQGELQRDSQEDKLTTAMMMVELTYKPRMHAMVIRMQGDKAGIKRLMQKLRVHDAMYFREQMLLAMKDEAGSNLNNEETDFMLDTLYGEETIKELNAAVMVQSIQTIHMLKKTPNKVYDPFLKGGLGYKNPERLKKVIPSQPKIYDGEKLHSAKLIIDSLDSGETLKDAKESRLKMRNKMVQINYTKLNALYETFVPQQDFFVEQTYFLVPSTSTNGSESKEVTSNLPIKEMLKESNLFKMFDKIGEAINGLRSRIDHTLLEDRQRRWMSDSQNSLRELYKTDVILMSASLSKNLKELKEELIEEVHISKKSCLWHCMLSHLKFCTINLLTSKDLVDGLLKFKYNKDHLCSACGQSKSKKALLSIKLVPDEPPDMIIDFINQGQRNLKAQILTIRTDNGTKFKNEKLRALYAKLAFDGNVFYNAPQTLIFEEAKSSSTFQDPSNMHEFYQKHRSSDKWTKNHPIEQVIGDPSKLVMTKQRLQTDAKVCVYTLTVSTIELKNIKEAMLDHSWIESMQDELNLLKRLDVWELVEYPIGRNIIVVK
nr:Gag-Pol polyprotein [Tanacetum cinerariifolium]